NGAADPAHTHLAADASAPGLAAEAPGSAGLAAGPAGRRKETARPRRPAQTIVADPVLGAPGGDQHRRCELSTAPDDGSQSRQSDHVCSRLPRPLTGDSNLLERLALD